MLDKCGASILSAPGGRPTVSFNHFNTLVWFSKNLEIILTNNLAIYKGAQNKQKYALKFHEVYD